MRKSLFYIPLIAAALILSACGPTTINQAAAPPVRSLTVSGVGEVNLAPDIAYIYIGVHTEKASASEAVDANNEQTQTLINALTDSGMDPKDIRTTNFSIWPSTQYGPNGESLGAVYMVDNTVYITVRDLEGLGDLLDAAIGAGANSINSIQFDVEDKTAALKEARAKAVENAGVQAEELAKTAGVELGQILNVNYYDTQPYPAIYGGKGGGGGGAAEAAVPIEPGQLTITANVTINYEIK